MTYCNGHVTLQIISNDMKSFIAKRLNSILVNLRYLGFKLLKNVFVILLIITSRIFLYI